MSAKDGAFDFPQSLVGKEIVLDGEAKLGTLSVNEQVAFTLEEDNKGIENHEIKKIKDVVFFEAKGLAIL